MSHIIFGGAKFVVGGKAEYFEKRVAYWRKIDPERADEISGGNAKTAREKLETQIRNSDIGVGLIAALRDLHAAMCRHYIREISEYVGHGLTPETDISQKSSYNENADAINFRITNDDKIGENYTDEMWLLKNMRFSGWDKNDDFKGWCPKEPVVRMRQLLRFPYQTFGIKMPVIRFPPIIDDEKSTLKDYETYYKNVMAAIRDYIDELNGV